MAIHPTCITSPVDKNVRTQSVFQIIPDSFEIKTLTYYFKEY